MVSTLFNSFGKSVEKHEDKIIAVPFYDVNVTDKFWNNRIELVNTVSVPYALEHGKPAINRLRQCADFRKGRSTELPFRHRFISSDLYKSLEAAAYSLEYKRNPQTEMLMDSIIAIIGEAQ